MSSVEEASLDKWDAELRVLLNQVTVSKQTKTSKRSEKTQEELRNILKQLLDVVWSVRRLKPKGNVNPNVLDLPHVVDPEQPCLICKAFMANVVFFPCWHCVVCSHCWKLYYTSKVTNDIASITAKQPNRGCPAANCQKRDVKNGGSLKQIKNAGDDNKVKYDPNYSEKNEYLGDSATLV